MKVLWVFWRIEYICLFKYEGCIFCDFLKENWDKERFIFYCGKYVFVIMNNYFYNFGYVMVVLYRYVGRWEDLIDEEFLEIMKFF